MHDQPPNSSTDRPCARFRALAQEWDFEQQQEALESAAPDPETKP